MSSVKFHAEQLKHTAEDFLDKAEAGDIPGISGKHPLAEAVGTVITGGLKNAGTKGYLAVCSLSYGLPRPTDVWVIDAVPRHPERGIGGQGHTI